MRCAQDIAAYPSALDTFKWQSVDALHPPRRIQSTVCSDMFRTSHGGMGVRVVVELLAYEDDAPGADPWPENDDPDPDPGPANEL